jgi:hypothetical protein
MDLIQVQTMEAMGTMDMTDMAVVVALQHREIKVMERDHQDVMEQAEVTKTEVAVTKTTVAVSKALEQEAMASSDLELF